MQMKRQCAQLIQDYQKPQKCNRFSPSPIKRYATMKSFPQLASDSNKENIDCNSQRPPCKRFKRLPLHEKQQNMQDITFNSQDTKAFIEKSKSLKEGLILPMNLSQLCDDKQQKNIMDFENKLEIQSPNKKRNEKLIRKLQEEESKSIREEQLQGLNEVTESKGSINEGISYKENDLVINLQLDKEVDSLMDATYHSATSGPQEIQYQGRWTPEEHQKFMEGLKMFGKEWRKIEDYIGSRSCAQIRSHAQKYFNRIQRDVAKGIPHKDASIAERLSKPKKTQFKIEQSVTPPIVPQQNEVLIQSQTNQQIQQIHETLQKLAEDDLLINLQQLIAQRELISMDLLLKRTSLESACERLIIIGNRFHQLAMAALKACKLITPIEESTEGQEIIQHVKLSPQTSIHDNFQSLDRESLSQITIKGGQGRDTAKTSPNSQNQRVFKVTDNKKKKKQE